MITVQGLSMNYAKTRGIVDVNITFPTGQVIGLFGQNGAGKTTLLKNMVGILKPDAGQVLFDERPLKYTMYQEIAYISEELSVFPAWTIAEHLAFYQTAFAKFQAERFAQLVDFFCLDTKSKVKTFSKGQKAKLELAIGFSKGAKYILMDEPFLGSDLLTRADFLKIMAAFLTEEDTVIIATHALSEIEQFIDHAIFLEYGKQKIEYTAEQLAQKGGLIAVAKQVYRYDEGRTQKLLS